MSDPKKFNEIETTEYDIVASPEISNADFQEKTEKHVKKAKKVVEDTELSDDQLDREDRFSRLFSKNLNTAYKKAVEDDFNKDQQDVLTELGLMLIQASRRSRLAYISLLVGVSSIAFIPAGVKLTKAMLKFVKGSEENDNKASEVAE